MQAHRTAIAIAIALGAAIGWQLSASFPAASAEAPKLQSHEALSEAFASVAAQEVSVEVTDSVAGPAWDSLGLIARPPGVVHSIGTDVWEVWVCDVPEGGATPTVEGAVRVLETELVPYFDWLSGGRYTPQFVSGGMATEAAGDDLFPCRESILQSTSGLADGVMVITDHANIPPAFARPSDLCGSECSSAQTFPENARAIVVGAHAVLPESPNFEPSRAAHEIGHAIGWPHSFVGRSEQASEYDNPLDVMSGNLYRKGAPRDRPQGTPAVNAYAAGWLDPSQVVVQTSGTAHHRLEPIGHAGTRLVAVPGDNEGTFVAIDARVSAGFDEGIRVEGVTLHFIDQRPDACDYPVLGGCYNHRRRTIPLVFDGVPSAYDHVVALGESAEGPGFRLSVIEREGDVFHIVLEVTEEPPFAVATPGPGPAPK